MKVVFQMKKMNNLGEYDIRNAGGINGLRCCRIDVSDEYKAFVHYQKSVDG